MGTIRQIVPVDRADGSRDLVLTDAEGNRITAEAAAEKVAALTAEKGAGGDLPEFATEV